MVGTSSSQHILFVFDSEDHLSKATKEVRTEFTRLKSVLDSLKPGNNIVSITKSLDELNARAKATKTNVLFSKLKEITDGEGKKIIDVKQYQDYLKTIDKIAKKEWSMAQAIDEKNKKQKLSNKENKNLAKYYDSVMNNSDKYYSKTKKSILDFSRSMGALSILFATQAMERNLIRLATISISSFSKIAGSTNPINKGLISIGANLEYLKFTIGEALGTAILPFLPSILSFIETVANWINEHPKLTAWVLGLSLITVWIFKTLASLILLAAGVKTLTGSASLTAWAKTTSIALKTNMATAFGAIQNSLVKLISFIIGPAGVAKIGIAFNTVGPVIIGFGKSIASSLLTFLLTTIGTIIAVGAAFSLWREPINNFLDNMGIIGDAIRIVGNLFGIFFNFVILGITSIGDLFSSLGTWIIDIFTWVGDTLRKIPFFKAFFDTLADGIEVLLFQLPAELQSFADQIEKTNANTKLAVDTKFNGGIIDKDFSKSLEELDKLKANQGVDISGALNNNNIAIQELQTSIKTYVEKEGPLLEESLGLNNIQFEEAKINIDDLQKAANEYENTYYLENLALEGETLADNNEQLKENIKLKKEMDELNKNKKNLASEVKTLSSQTKNYLSSNGVITPSFFSSF